MTRRKLPLRTATAFSVLTYLGFDGVTTLAEDVQNPRRSVPLATVLTMLLTGVFSSIPHRTRLPVYTKCLQIGV